MADLPQLSAKDFLVIIPAGASALAAAYDVGFFSGLGGNFFSVFSLSEHVLFGLQQLPLALVVAIVLFLKPWWDSRFPMPDAALATPARRAFTLLPLPILFAFVLYASWREDTWSALSLAGLAISWGYIRVVTPSGMLPKLAHMVALSILLIGCAWTFGLDHGKAAAKGAKPVVTLRLDTGKAEGQIIRTGERGVLIAEVGTGRVRLVRWDDIKEVATNIADTIKSPLTTPPASPAPEAEKSGN